MHHFNNINIIDEAKKYFFLGLESFEKNNFLKAEEYFNLSLNFSPNKLSTKTNLIATLINLEKLSQAELLVKDALAIVPDDALLHLNYGNILLKKCDFTSAISIYSKTISINPTIAEAYNNRGIAFTELMQEQLALTDFTIALSLKPDYLEAYYNNINLLIELKLWNEASTLCRKAMHIDPHYEDLLCIYLGIKFQVCDWDNLLQMTEDFIVSIKLDKVITNPFRTLFVADDPTLHKIASTNFANNLNSSTITYSLPPFSTSHDKIRIGYYSADFHNHATSYLIAELFELHDKSRFELYGFSFGPNTSDSSQIRIKRSFDTFIDIREMSDLEVVELSRKLGITIAVDLKGYTLHNRFGIFAKRCAPIQVSYLGYPGTMGSNFIDYIIADRTVIPNNQVANYIEKIIFLPFSYQVNDSSKTIANGDLKKSDFGLPNVGFIFCCFNSSHKITPHIFDIWMEILLVVENSVLWLLEDNELSVKNLRNEALIRGVSADRLIFAKHMKLEHHLDRHKFADLFLDTLPYNAHTTASDALWAGLPVLTCLGKSFASRVSASLLNSLNLTDLICNNLLEYKSKALFLAKNPSSLNSLKNQLNTNKYTSPLFNTALFTSHLETAYTEIHRRYSDGKQPSHIYIDQ